MVDDFTRGTLSLSRVCIATEPDRNGLSIVCSSRHLFYVVSKSPLPTVGTWISMVVMATPDAFALSEGYKPFEVRFWDYL